MLIEAADTYEEYLQFVQASNGTARNVVDVEYKYDYPEKVGGEDET